MQSSANQQQMHQGSTLQPCMSDVIGWMSFTKKLFQVMDVEPKIGVVFPPKSSHLFIGFGTIINHPFWGTPIFGNTLINILDPQITFC